MWSILRNKVRTRANLMRRSFARSFWCDLCKSDNEDTDHHFLHCPFSQELWNSFLRSISSVSKWRGPNLTEAWNSWCTSNSVRPKNIPLLISWAIWIARNLAIFHQRSPHWISITSRLLADYNSIPEEEDQPIHRIITPKVIKLLMDQLMRWVVGLGLFFTYLILMFTKFKWA